MTTIKEKKEYQSPQILLVEMVIEPFMTPSNERFSNKSGIRQGGEEHVVVEKNFWNTPPVSTE